MIIILLYERDYFELFSNDFRKYAVISIPNHF